MSIQALSADLGDPRVAADVATTLDALEAACENPALQPAVRTLLCDARDALRAVMAEAEAARQSYRALFDAVPDPVSIIAWDGIVLDLNKAGMNAYRRPREEIVGQPIEVLNPDLPRDHMGPVWDALNRGESYVIEVTNMRGDGTRFPVEVHTANIDYEGRRCMVAVARDLSGRRDAELRHRELMETIDKGIVVRDASGGVVYGNVAAIRMIQPQEGAGLDDELRSDRWTVIDEHGRVLSRDELPSARAMRTGKVVESALIGYYNRPRRRLSWFSVTAVPQYRAGEDRPHQVLSMFSDVTALKRETALFDRAQLLAHIGGWEWDAAGGELYLTEEARRILGESTPNVTMEAMLAHLHEADRRRLRTALDRAQRTGIGLDLELQGTGAAGRMIWLRVIGEAELGEATTALLTGTLQDITERKLAEETLRVQARTDPLTGLINRDAALSELEARLEDDAQSGLAVLYVDLDRFKIVNDVLGHGAGDDLLVSASRRIRKAVGTEGLISRFGGDEFLVICATADDDTRPQRLAQAILDAFGAGFRLDGEELGVTASVGIARAPADGDRAHLLIQNADLAMYDSKRRVRNGWQAFTPELAQQQHDRLQIETQLRRALDNGEFRLVYQPQVGLIGGEVLGVEALIRWDSHALGEMRPDRFIGHAETTGDIVRIGGWVLRQACRQVRLWRDSGLNIARVAVNVSYRQFLGEDLALSVREALAESGLPGEALELEFTERVLIQDAPDTLKTFDALRALGVMLTIDDFGEGYSALNYLRRLPIHGLKLSPLFLQGVPGNPSDAAICRAVAGIAHSLGLGIVAEGVESDLQRRFLLDLGVSVGQGFLFAPGLSPEELAYRLRHTSRLLPD